MKATIYKVTRRDFLKQAGVGTGALVLGCSIAPDALGVNLPTPRELIHGIPVPAIPFVALKINGDVVIITHRAEMGQGIRTSLAAVLADEMEADWRRVHLRQADADSTKFGVPFPYPVPPESKLGYPYATRNLAKPQFILEHDVAQFTDSSRSMAAYYVPMRLYGCALRMAMIFAAARKWGVPASECWAEEHKVKHKDHRPIDYSRLLLGAQKAPVPTYEELQNALKPREKWRYINNERIRETFESDARAMVTGKLEYGADVRMRGMLTAMIERCPVANGDVKSFDATEALKVPGVVKVMKVAIPNRLGPGGVGTAFLPHAGVAVIAENTWAAWQGRRKLKPTIEWDYSSPAASENRHYDSAEYRKTLHASTSQPGIHVRNRGNVDDAFAGAANVVEAHYYVPHLAQAPMEPPVAIARLDGDRLEVWAPTQNPDVAQYMAGNIAFGIPYENWDTEQNKEEMRKKVTLHMPLLGGGFGRKSKPDYVLEAAFLAKENPGVPIRVQWTREDDIQFAYFNAVSDQYLKASLGADGRPTALLQRSAFTSLFATLFPPPRKDFSDDFNAFFKTARSGFRLGGEYPYGSSIERSQGLEDLPFDVPNLRIENCPAPNHIRVGWMRSVANVYHAFAVCSFADEMALAARRDPKDYLLDLIGTGNILNLAAEGVVQNYNNEFPIEKIEVPFSGSKVFQVIPGYPPDTRRLRKVVEEVARISGWDAKKGKLGPRRGLGIAAHRSFLSYVALVLDVSLTEKNELTINEAFCAIDCGMAVNVDRVRAQIEGGINYGLSMALLGEITVKNGAVEQTNFDNYPVLRIDHSPKKITIEMLRTDYDPTGVGEPPTPVVAPALANAIVAAGGPRLREMPFRNRIVV